jgi:hypothetical protein
MTERGAVRLVRIAGSSVLLLFIAFQVVNPRRPAVANTPGFSDPVAGFELASTPDDVLNILGPPGSPVREETVRRMVAGTRLDFLFLVAYPAFTAGIALWLVARGAPRWLGTVTIALAVAMAVGDALENLELLRLARTLEPAMMTPALARLRVFTLLKWWAIYAAAGLLAVFVWRERGWWRWTAAPFGLAAVCGLVSVAHRPAIEWGIAPLGLAWLATYVRSFARPGV